jgi:hypothetical protein
VAYESRTSNRVSALAIQPEEKTMEELISNAIGLASNKYYMGYDRFIECYGTDEWQEFVTNDDGSLKSWAEVKSEMAEMASIWLEREQEAMLDAW